MIKTKKQKIKYLIVRRTIASMILAFSICIFMSGCKKTDYQENVIFTQDEKKELFTYTNVLRGDVYLTHGIVCKYVQASGEDYAFLTKDVIKAIYVSEGDIVKKGQLLAELENDGTDEKIKDSNYVIDKNTLLINQAKEQMDLDLQEAEALYNLTDKSQADKTEYNKKVDDIKDSYDDMLENYNNTIDVEKLKLDDYHKKNDESAIYAGMSGTISYADPSLVGTYSNTDDIVISIVDNTDCVYVADEIDYKSYFIDQELVDLHVGAGNNEKIYSVKPSNVSSWTNQMVFTLKDETYTPRVGDAGFIYALLEQSDNVLYLDNIAVHKANGEYYVYILDDQGNRIMQPVTIGLQGDKTTEIVNGLKEGEQVILAMNK